MSKREFARAYHALLVSAFFALPIGGCGGGSVTTPPAVGPLDTQNLAAALPKGVTLQTAVRPDKAYGESSKTVEDALKNLLATVKDNTIRDALGHEIRFESSGSAPPKAAKGQRAQVVVYLAN